MEYHAFYIAMETLAMIVSCSAVIWFLVVVSQELGWLKNAEAKKKPLGFSSLLDSVPSEKRTQYLTYMLEMVYRWKKDSIDYHYLIDCMLVRRLLSLNENKEIDVEFRNQFYARTEVYIRHYLDRDKSIQHILDQMHFDLDLLKIQQTNKT
jgi:hypothetical protein